MLVIVVSLRLSFPPPAAPVPGAGIVHADIFVVFCIYFVNKTFFFDRFCWPLCFLFHVFVVRVNAVITLFDIRVFLSTS